MVTLQPTQQQLSHGDFSIMVTPAVLMRPAPSFSRGAPFTSGSTSHGPLCASVGIPSYRCTATAGGCNDSGMPATHASIARHAATAPPRWGDGAVGRATVGGRDGDVGPWQGSISPLPGNRAEEEGAQCEKDEAQSVRVSFGPSAGAAVTAAAFYNPLPFSRDANALLHRRAFRHQVCL